MDKDILGKDGRDKNESADEKDGGGETQKDTGGTLAAAWVALALSMADVPGLPPSPALLGVEKLLGQDEPKQK
jgi:hypothetical protein